MQIHDTHYDTYIEYVKTTITFILCLRITKYVIIKKEQNQKLKIVILINILIDRVLCCCIVDIITNKYWHFTISQCKWETERNEMIMGSEIPQYFSFLKVAGSFFWVKGVL